MERKTHETIKRVTEDIEQFEFNTAISAIMELVNAIYSLEFKVYSKEAKDAIEAVVILLSPFTPHVCEEMWGRLGYGPSILKTPWPKYNPEILRREEVMIIVQVKGNFEPTAGRDIHWSAL